MKSVLTRDESQAYDFTVLGKHEGNSGLEDGRPAAYLCFGTLIAPHCATQVFLFRAEELPRLFPDKKPDHIGLFGNTTTQNPRPRPHEKLATQSHKIRYPSPRLLPRVASTPPAQGPYFPKPDHPAGDLTQTSVRRAYHESGTSKGKPYEYRDPKAVLSSRQTGAGLSSSPQMRLQMTPAKEGLMHRRRQDKV